MHDTSGHDATRRDDLHTLTLRELEAKIIQAGIVMSRRQIMRHCKSGTFDAQKLPAANNVEEWFIAPGSVEKGIADIKTLQALRSRRDATRHDLSGDDAPERGQETDIDMSGRDATRPDMTDKKTSAPIATTHQDTSRRDTTSDIDIFEHPYVKRLEGQVEKWEGKYQEQVRRTEDIQRDHQKALIELQRMTAVGNSKTLADFMLQAKDWVLGQGSQPTKPEATNQPTT